MESLESHKIPFYAQSFEDLGKRFRENDLVSAGVGRLFNWHYKAGHKKTCVEGLALKSQDFLAKEFHFELPKIDQVFRADDKTVKFLFKLSDGRKVESVLIPFQKKYSLCLSSQVGCAMKCSFCFTGTQGLTRHLSTQEIVGQFLGAQEWLSQNRPEEDRILNLVFMGQGEPLHNFDAIKKACEIFLCQHGLSLGRSKITVSTSGYLPGLQKWRDEMPDVNLALSLHSPFNAKRNELIPLNKCYPLETILPIIQNLPLGRKRFITYEYLVIKGFNDSEEDAHATGSLIQDQKALVNLIPFNPYPGSPYERPDIETMEVFKSILEQYCIPTMVRTTKGDDILAACGQLNTREESV
jgi:23S rRNA (adenine2503-C2)-methyltransferase